MPAYNDKARARIDRVVKAVEANFADLRSSGQKYGSPSAFRWFELTEAFDSETHEATAKIITWSASANGGEGQLDVSEDEFEVRDTTLGKWGGGDGDWVLCRPVGANAYTVWEVVSVAGDLPRGTTTNDILKWVEGEGDEEGAWVIFAAPLTTGTFALTVVDGDMTWTECDEC
jgi:hypothetical protein